LQNIEIKTNLHFREVQLQTTLYKSGYCGVCEDIRCQGLAITLCGRHYHSYLIIYDIARASARY